MSGKTGSKSNRAGWIAIHGGIVAWVICLIVLAEEHRDGGETGGRGSVHAPQSDSSAAQESAEFDAWVDRRVDALSDPVFGVRAKATRQLIAAGPKVIDRLSLALSSKDPEVFRRTQTILARLVRGDDDGFLALERIAGNPDHPAARTAEAILQHECDRRERVLATLSEQRKNDAHRYLREARAALYQGQFTQARKKARAAEALEIVYGQFDDRPKLVLRDIERAESRTAANPRPILVTAERE
jgi:hypothetical protein